MHCKPRNQFAIDKAGILDSGLFLYPPSRWWISACIFRENALPWLCQTWGYIAFGKNQIATECFVSNLKGQRILGATDTTLRPQSVPQILL